MRESLTSKVTKYTKKAMEGFSDFMLMLGRIILVVIICGILGTAIWQDYEIKGKDVIIKQQTIIIRELEIRLEYCKD